MSQVVDLTESAKVIAALTDRVLGRVITDPDIMMGYSRDQCMIAANGTPLAVVLAHSTSDVQTVMRIATEYRIPVVTRGAGTGLAGGANALDGCIVLSVAAMSEILDIDTVNRLARVQAGVINADLDGAARQHGLFYAPDPGSRSISTIGGNLATNAGGMCCAKYGVTRDHALALTVVLASGEVITAGTLTRKDSCGLALVPLIVGSEGTLGVITEAAVRLTPLPQGRATVVATFRTTGDAIDFVTSSLHQPAAAEIMDRVTVKAVNAMTGMGLDESAGATLIIQLDSSTPDDDATRTTAAAEAHGVIDTFFTTDHTEGSMFMEARRAALPALERLGSVLLDDVCVPVGELPAMQTHIDMIANTHQLTIGTFGHAADGNLHPTIVFDPTDAQAASRASEAFKDIVLAAINLGGTATGEHGVGSLKQPFVAHQVGHTESQLMADVKRAFDPHNLLNPGRAI